MQQSNASPTTIFAGIITTLVLLSPIALAKTATLMGMEAKTQDNQIVLYLSNPAAAQTSMPVSPMTNEKTLVIDLDDVQVPKIGNKEALLNAIKNALPDVSQITMSEFAGSKPMVRLAIKLMSPDINARLMQSANNELVIQLDKAPLTYNMPSTTVASLPQTPSTIATDAYGIQDTYNPNRPSVLTQSQIPGKTSSGQYLPSVTPKTNTGQMTLARKDANEPAEKPCDIPKRAYVSADRTDIYRTTGPMSYYNDYTQSVYGFQHTYPEVNTNDIGNDISSTMMPYKNKKSDNQDVPVKLPDYKRYTRENTVDNNLTSSNSMQQLQSENQRLRQQLNGQQVSMANPVYTSPVGPNAAMSSNAIAANGTLEAERAYLLAIQSQPADADLYYNLANLYLQNRQYQSALNNYQSALRYQPNLAEAYYQMGVAHAEQGDRSNALAAMQNYIRLAPSAPNRSQVQQFINSLQ